MNPDPNHWTFVKKIKYNFLMILADVLLLNDPDPGGRKVPDLDSQH